MGGSSRQLHSSPASVGIAERSPVITPVPAFGSSVYRVVEVVKEPVVTDGDVKTRLSMPLSAAQRQLLVTLVKTNSCFTMKMASTWVVPDVHVDVAAFARRYHAKGAGMDSHR